MLGGAGGCAFMLKFYPFYTSIHSRMVEDGDAQLGDSGQRTRMKNVWHGRNGGVYSSLLLGRAAIVGRGWGFKHPLRCFAVCRGIIGRLEEQRKDLVVWVEPVINRSRSHKLWHLQLLQTYHLPPSQVGWVKNLYPVGKKQTNP